jgi:hypothetical protein
MPGTMLVLRPREEPKESTHKTPPTLTEIARLIDDKYIEPIDGFTSIGWPRSKPIAHQCVAFHAQSKTRQRPNTLASFLWLQSAGISKAMFGDAEVKLCGPVVVLFGDSKFMKEIGNDHQPRKLEHANRQCPQAR